MICSHDRCGCVGGADGYCSAMCRAMALDPEPVGAHMTPAGGGGDDCGCGHDACHVQVPSIA